MIICRVSDDDAGSAGKIETVPAEDHSHEFQTANELFDLMAKNHNFEPSGDEALTTRDLVILYKNIDLGTKLMSSANDFKRKSPNQYVETVVYNDDRESDSDISEICSSEDLHNVILINKERIELLNNPSSLENTLCHKFGDFDLQTDQSIDYDRQFVFKDPYIKEQLKNLNLLPGGKEFEGSVLPVSLLDYICCKRLEDNYNFYMDNIIRYVQHTIDQLKRISNGDYLTDKAKEKWREVEKDSRDEQDTTKILAKCTSIPLHVEGKITGNSTTWDDIVHSEVDVRYLSKILEKKIVVEIPKTISSPYKLFSKCCAGNLIISCKKETRPNMASEDEKESRVDVVFKLERSECGQVMSNINSIMILPKHKVEEEATGRKTLPLAYEVHEDAHSSSVEPENSLVTTNESYRILELENNSINDMENQHSLINCDDDFFEFDDVSPHDESDPLREKRADCEDVTTVPMVDIRDMLSRKRSHRPEASFNIIPGDELHLTMQRLNIQSSLPEECSDDMPNHAKRKSPTRNRVKSPYQNNSYILEEKKRKKLLEIRQRREKKKMAMSENCKVTKHKYAKNAVMPATSSSVTKLSITNKSFYNSIYGQTFSTNSEQSKQLNKTKERKDTKRDIVITVPSEHSVSEDEISKKSSSPTERSQQCVAHNYFFDDSVTETMYLKMKRTLNDKVSDSTSVNPSTIDIKAREVSFTTQENMQRLDKIISEMDQKGRNAPDLITTRSNTIMIVPANTPKDSVDNTPKDSVDGIKRSSTSNTSIAFRKSIDKIYELMEKLGKTEASEPKPKKSKFTARSNEEQKFCATSALEGSTAQCTESGTSVKHHILSSTPSYISFDKYKACDDDNYCVDTVISKSSESKNLEETTVLVPKVIINSKSPSPDTEKNKSNRKKSTDRSPIQVNENPLKAISQLLHDIDNVQKTRQKSNTEFKSPKKREPQKPVDIKNNVRPNPTSRKQGKSDQKFNPKAKLSQGDHMKNPILDIVDEYKEARGEAVRGPSKVNSRLNTLAQPKKSYVQAHIEDYQTRYGRNIMSDRLQKLSTVQAPPTTVKPRPAYLKNKQKKTGIDAGLTSSIKRSSSPSPPLENLSKYKHIGNNDMSIPKSQCESARKHDNLPFKQENIKNKMVSVESYVKNHYGRSSPSASSARWNLTSRAPLVPNDLGYTSSMESTNSPEQSATIGRKLHNIIDTMIINTQTELSCVRESNETNSKDSNSTGNLSKEDRVSIMSDYGEYEFEQRSVQGLKQNVPCSVTSDIQQLDAQVLSEALNNINTETELEKLENALHQKLPTGAFHKRLRIRNFTLTPKHSLQQTVVLQSGDCNTSFVLKSTLSQNFKMKNCKSETLARIKTLSSASNTKMNWNFNIPMQITTVGYAFPELQKVPSSVVGFLKNKTVERKSSAQNQDQINGMPDNGDHSCDSGNQVQFGDFVNIFNTNSDPASPEVCKTVQKDNSDANNLKDVNQTEDVVVKQDTEDSNKKAIDVTAISNKSVDTLVNKMVDSSRSIQSDNVGCSSSLDILVCLLNEIQKITTCGLHSEGFDSNQQSKQLIAVLNEATTLRDSVHNKVKDVISIASFDKLRRVESKHSIFSFYVANNGDKKKHDYETKIVSMDVMHSRNELNDKEVNVNIQEKEFVHAFTDVPSRFLPVTITSGTYMSNSLIGIISEPSTQSIINLNDVHSNLLTAHKKIIEIPQHIATDVVPAAVSVKTNEIATENSCVNSGKVVKSKVRKGHKKISDVVKVNRNCDSFVNGVITRKSDALGADEQVMKIKRDVLVTLYSILVFTVFAALSFPDMLSRV